MTMHRLDLLAKLLDLRATDHPTTGPVVLGDDASEENYELDAVLEAMCRLLMAMRRDVVTMGRECDALADQQSKLRGSLNKHGKALREQSIRMHELFSIDHNALDAVHAYVKEAGL